jgi:hypothetical protein
MAIVRASWLICDDHSFTVWQQEVDALPPRKCKN